MRLEWLAGQLQQFVLVALNLHKRPDDFYQLPLLVCPERSWSRPIRKHLHLANRHWHRNLNCQGSPRLLRLIHILLK